MAGFIRDLKTVAAAPSGTGDVTVISAVSGKRIFVVAFALVASAASVVSFKSGANAISGGMSLAANGGVALSAHGDYGFLFSTNLNEALTIAQSVDGVDGLITYFLA
jgi:hypothetical protein